MALRCNGNQFASSGVQFAGAAVVLSAIPSVLQGNFMQTGRIRNLTAGEGITDDTVGLPSGYRHPGAWMMPQKAGRLTSHNNTQGTSTASAIPISLQGLIAGTCTVSATVAAILLMAGQADGTSTASLVRGAKGWLIGESGGVCTVSLVSHAYGELVGSITPFTTLSPENLANAVWSQAIEAGFSAEEILRILAAFAAGSATGLEGADPQFTGIDGTTLRIDGAYSGGTRTIDSLNGA